ncbi:hypothetical protein GVAV_000309 [Gurleya vavrai]
MDLYYFLFFQIYVRSSDVYLFGDSDLKKKAFLQSLAISDQKFKSKNTTSVSSKIVNPEMLREIKMIDISIEDINKNNNYVPILIKIEESDSSCKSNKSEKQQIESNNEKIHNKKTLLQLQEEIMNLYGSDITDIKVFFDVINKTLTFFASKNGDLITHVFYDMINDNIISNILLQNENNEQENNISLNQIKKIFDYKPISNCNLIELEVVKIKDVDKQYDNKLDRIHKTNEEYKIFYEKIIKVYGNFILTKTNIPNVYCTNLGTLVYETEEKSYLVLAFNENEIHQSNNDEYLFQTKEKNLIFFAPDQKFDKSGIDVHKIERKEKLTNKQNLNRNQNDSLPHTTQEKKLQNSLNKDFLINNDQLKVSQNDLIKAQSSNINDKNLLITIEDSMEKHIDTIEQTSLKRKYSFIYDFNKKRAKNLDSPISKSSDDNDQNPIQAQKNFTVNSSEINSNPYKQSEILSMVSMEQLYYKLYSDKDFLNDFLTIGLDHTLKIRDVNIENSNTFKDEMRNEFYLNELHLKNLIKNIKKIDIFDTLFFILNMEHKEILESKEYYEKEKRECDDYNFVHFRSYKNISNTSHGNKIEDQYKTRIFQNARLNRIEIKNIDFNINYQFFDETKIKNFDFLHYYEEIYGEAIEIPIFFNPCVKYIILNENFDFHLLVKFADLCFKNIAIKNSDQEWDLLKNKVCNVFKPENLGICSLFKELLLFEDYLNYKIDKKFKYNKSISILHVTFFLYVFEIFMKHDWLSKISIFDYKNIISIDSERRSNQLYEESRTGKITETQAIERKKTFLYTFSTMHQFLNILVFPFMKQKSYKAFIKHSIFIRLKLKNVFTYDSKINQTNDILKYIDNNLNLYKNIIFCHDQNFLFKKLHKFKGYDENCDLQIANLDQTKNFESLMMLSKNFTLDKIFEMKIEN